MTRDEAYVGQKVYFGRKNGEKSLGEVTKVNRKNLKVRLLEARGTYRSYKVGGLWSVPPSLCWPADEGKPAQVTKPRRAKRPCLVNVLTGERTYGRPGESEDSLFGRMANGLL
jgi:hypothetical protein